MTGCHPDKCPEITQLAGMLGLGLSSETTELIVPTEQLIEEVLAWVDACPTCSENLTPLDRWQDEVGYPDLAVVARERNRARELWEKLENVPTEALPDHVGDEHVFWAMSQLLQQKSREAVRFSTERAVMLGQIAVHLADILPASYYAPVLLPDLQAQARAYLGNSLRLAGRYAQADVVFGRAAERLEQGSGGVMARAVVLDFLGSLRKDQRRLQEAVDVLMLSASLYEAAGRPELVAKVTITIGHAEDLRGNLEAAVAHLTKAQELIDPSKDLSLFVNCQHHLIHLLTEAGHFDEAELRLPLAKRLYRECGDTTNLLNLRWIEARIFRGQRLFEAARTVFHEVTHGFESIGQETQLGFCKLDQACLECELGQLDTVKQLAAEAYEIFDRNGAPRQRVAALAVFSQAAEAESASVELIQSVTRYLSEPVEEAQLPFRPPSRSGI